MNDFSAPGKMILEIRAKERSFCETCKQDCATMDMTRDSDYKECIGCAHRKEFALYEKEGKK